MPFFVLIFLMFGRGKLALKDINIVTSLVGKGLEREAYLLKDLFAAHDIYTVLIHYCNWAGSTLVRADVNIFLEVVHPLAFSLSRENWFFPNCEWYDTRNDQFLHRFTRVCCKTRECYRVWREKLSGDRPERVCYTGFEARDLYDPAVERENRFLHVAGESEFKNTESVIEAWKRGNWSYKPLPITVVTRQKKYQDMVGEEGVPGLTLVSHKVADEELTRLMNSHRFHLMPSAYEGFGHALHEGVGCGALVLTTGAPPMSEVRGIVPEWCVKPSKFTKRGLAQLSRVEWYDVQVACGRAIVAADSRPHEFEGRRATARAAFLDGQRDFRAAILALLGVS